MEVNVQVENALDELKKLKAAIASLNLVIEYIKITGGSPILYREVKTRMQEIFDGAV